MYLQMPDVAEVLHPYLIYRFVLFGVFIWTQDSNSTYKYQMITLQVPNISGF
jgi:hypothetical protein